MKQPFEQLLEECLSQLNSGTADLETILARHPEHAARLRPLLRVAHAVRETPQPTPSRAAKAAGRQRLLVAAARKRQQREAARKGVRRYLDEVITFLNWVSRSGQPLRRAAVWAMAVLLVVVVTSVGVTQVAARSLPDTPLYPIKLASERIQLALAPSPAERARLHMAFGERRLKEAQMLAQAGRPLNTALAEMVKQNKQTFGAIAQVPTEERVPLLEDLALLTRAERKTLNEVKQALPLPDQLAVAEAIAISAEDQARAEEAQRNPALVQFIPTSLPPTLTPFVPMATPTLLPTATPVQVVVPPPEKPGRTPAPTATKAPTKTAVPTATATEKPAIVIVEQPPLLTPTPTNTPVMPTATPVKPPPEASPTPVSPTATPIVPMEEPTTAPVPTLPWVEPTSAPPPTLPPPP